jgi:hypothetical protein
MDRMEGMINRNCIGGSQGLRPGLEPYGHEVAIMSLMTAKGQGFAHSDSLTAFYSLTAGLHAADD